ncbi:hypothetical protein ABIA52_001158 [Paenarthrobacter histidinolovorans]|uniref:Uncharacterized protein n=1 Tax=Paenarthrobacter histidinolovorans TaxID=43664 RepID=A0ABW8N4K4_9MICC
MGAIDRSRQVADAAGDNQLGTRVGHGFRGGSHAGVATEVTGTKSKTESALRTGNVVGFLDAQGRLHQRDHGSLAVHAVVGLGDLVGGLGLGQHHTEQTRSAAQSGEVVGPELAGGIVDADPGLATCGQPVHHVFARGILLGRVHGVFDVKNDGVCARTSGFVEKLRFHRIHKKP